MTVGRFRRWSGAAACCLVVLVACTDESEPAAGQVDQALCDREARTLVDGLQAYVDGFDGVGPLEYAVGADLPDAASIERALARYGERIASFDCDEQLALQTLTSELEGLHGDGAVGEAVARGLRQTALGERTDQAREIEVGPDDDLAGIAVTAPSGSTLRLSAGDHRADEPVVVPHALTIVGEGQDRTRLLSTAEGSAIIVLGTAELDLADLTVTHDAASAAAVLLAATSYELRNVTIEGARTDDDGSGGIGLYLESVVEGPRGPDDPDALPGQTLDGVTVRGNEGPGVYVAGTSAPQVTDGSFVDNGSCGVCFVQDAAGRWTDLSVTGNEVGLLLTGRADPDVGASTLSENRADGVVVDGAGRGRFVDNRIAANGERGITVGDEAAPTFEGNRITGNGRIGVVALGSSRPVIEDNEVSGSQIGIWIEEDAHPELGGNTISGPDGSEDADGPGTGNEEAADADDVGPDGEGSADPEDDAGPEVGIVLSGTARGVLTGGLVRHVTIGIEVQEDATLDLADVRIDDVEEAAVVLRDRAALTATGLACTDAPLGVVVLDEAAADLAGDGCPEQRLE